MAKFCLFFPAQNVAFMVLKTTGTISRFQQKNRFVKWPNIARDINQNQILADGSAWLTKWKNNFVYILGQDASFFKPIFALKPWDWDGHFEYNKRYKRGKKDVENSVHEPQILPQKPKIAEKLDLIGQNCYSFRYLWPLIEWNQVKYPKQHFLFFILFPNVIS